MQSTSYQIAKTNFILNNYIQNCRKCCKMESTFFTAFSTGKNTKRYTIYGSQLDNAYRKTIFCLLIQK